VKSILISIKPKYCGLIASGEKTVEVRKSHPKLETPFKCYIYCTKGKTHRKTLDRFTPNEQTIVLLDESFINGNTLGNGKVIGESVCDRLEPLHYGQSYNEKNVCFMLAYGARLTVKEVNDYARGKTIYGWHISGLRIYDTPKELGEFYRWAGWEELRPCENHKPCEYLSFDISENQQCCSIDYDGDDCPYIRVSKPPQSWCYIDD
jgi:predicted transcriptional regulator